MHDLTERIAALTTFPEEPPPGAPLDHWQRYHARRVQALQDRERLRRDVELRAFDLSAEQLRRARKAIASS